MKHSPTLYLFVGYPGAGKTTTASIIGALTGAVHIWADRERQKMFGRPTHSLEESAQLYHHLNSQTKQLLEQGKDVVFDTNFNYQKDRAHLQRIAKEAGARTVIIEMTTPPEIARHRALAGQHAEKNGMPGVMAEATFNRIVHHREAYAPGEQPIRINGENVTKDAVKQALGL